MKNEIEVIIRPDMGSDNSDSPTSGIAVSELGDVRIVDGGSPDLYPAYVSVDCRVLDGGFSNFELAIICNDPENPSFNWLNGSVTLKQKQVKS